MIREAGNEEFHGKVCVDDQRPELGAEEASKHERPTYIEKRNSRRGLGPRRQTTPADTSYTASSCLIDLSHPRPRDSPPAAAASGGLNSPPGNHPRATVRRPRTPQSPSPPECDQPQATPPSPGSNTQRGNKSQQRPSPNDFPRLASQPRAGWGMAHTPVRSLSRDSHVWVPTTARTQP